MSEDKSIQSYRRKFDVTQAEMANRMGLPSRTFQDIESGKVGYRLVHRAALDLALLHLAAEKNLAAELPDHLKDLIMQLAPHVMRERAAIIDGGGFQTTVRPHLRKS